MVMQEKENLEIVRGCFDCEIVALEEGSVLLVDALVVCGKLEKDASVTVLDPSSNPVDVCDRWDRLAREKMISQPQTKGRKTKDEEPRKTNLEDRVKL